MELLLEASCHGLLGVRRLAGILGSGMGEEGVAAPFSVSLLCLTDERQEDFSQRRIRRCSFDELAGEEDGGLGWVMEKGSFGRREAELTLAMLTRSRRRG